MDAYLIILPYFLFRDTGMNTAHGLKYCCYPKCPSESKDKRIRHGDDRPLSIEPHKTNLIRLGHYSEDSFAVLPASHHFFHESCYQRFRREYTKQFTAPSVPVLPVLSFWVGSATAENGSQTS